MLSRRAALSALATAALAGCSAGASTTSTATATDTPGRPDPPAVEAAVLDELNQARREHGLDPFAHHDRAATAAREHARDMAQRDYFGHTSPDGETQEERYAFCGGGELNQKLWFGRPLDLADGTTRTISTAEGLADAALVEWLGSRPHRERGVFGPWSSAGPGVAVDTDGSVYITVGVCR